MSFSNGALKLMVDANKSVQQAKQLKASGFAREVGARGKLKHCPSSQILGLSSEQADTAVKHGIHEADTFNVV